MRTFHPPALSPTPGNSSCPPNQIPTSYTPDSKHIRYTTDPLARHRQAPLRPPGSSRVSTLPRAAPPAPAPGARALRPRRAQPRPRPGRHPRRRPHLRGPAAWRTEGPAGPRLRRPAPPRPGSRPAQPRPRTCSARAGLSEPRSCGRRVLPPVGPLSARSDVSGEEPGPGEGCRTSLGGARAEGRRGPGKRRRGSRHPVRGQAGFEPETRMPEAGSPETHAARALALLPGPTLQGPRELGTRKGPGRRARLKEEDRTSPGSERSPGQVAR